MVDRYAGILDPAHGAVAREILKQLTIRITPPNQFFDPSEPSCKLLEPTVREDIMGDARAPDIEAFHDGHWNGHEDWGGGTSSNWITIRTAGASPIVPERCPRLPSRSRQS